MKASNFRSIILENCTDLKLIEERERETMFTQTKNKLYHKVSSVPSERRMRMLSSETSHSEI
jgi:hypothetical protein